MAESNFIYYRGFPMVRSGNEIYYGSMSLLLSQADFR